MNSKNIELITNKSYPFFPELSGTKRTRAFTKHFTNLPLYMDPDHCALLSWLVYQSKQDNSVRYSTHLLTQYRNSVLAAPGLYSSVTSLKVSIQLIRKNYGDLIEQGYLLSTGEKFIHLINPMLTYRWEYIRASEYLDFCKRYESIRFGTSTDMIQFCKDYMSLINGRIKKKKE